MAATRTPPPFFLTTPFSAPKFHFGLLSLSSEYVYCPACIKTTEWIECPGSVTTTTTLFPPRSRLFLGYHSQPFLSNWLFDSRHFERFASLLSFYFLHFCLVSTNGQVSVVFFFPLAFSKWVLITCWRTRWRFSGVQKELKPLSSYFSSLCPDNNSKAQKDFFLHPPGIDHLF